MKIVTQKSCFVPTNFVILNFYGTDTCFSWNEEEFVCFPYLKDRNGTPILNVLKSPGKIKDFRNFNERVYILCYPTGIYKLTHNYELATLSKAGIELGSSFFEVFTPINGTLILEDKKQKNTKRLCTIDEGKDIHVLSLSIDKTDKCFYEIFLPSECKNIDGFCFFAYDHKLFKICQQNLQINYSCNHLITKIIPVEKNQKISAIILQTNVDIIILMHIVNKKLRYDQIHVDTKIESLCVVDIKSQLLFIYYDGGRVHYATKKSDEDLLQVISSEKKHYQNFKLYQSQFIIFLNSCGELSQININQMQQNDEQANHFIELKPDMLNGIEDMVEVISSKITELKELQKELKMKEDTLKRINLFTTKNYIMYCPQDWVTRILRQTILVSNFKKVLPESSIIVKMLKSKERTIFAMKTVKNDDTVIEMPITLTNLSSNLYTTTDLITHKRNGGVWCLIKNYVKDPLPTENTQIDLTLDKRKFIKHKLLVIENMIKKNKVSLEQLSSIKSEVRTLL